MAEANALLQDADHIRRFVAIAEPGIEHIVVRVADGLQPHWPVAMRTLFAATPKA